MNYTAKDYAHMAGLRRSAFTRIARELGKDHAITKIMGSAAWGRCAFEHGPESNLQIEVRYAAGQDGMADVLKSVARYLGDEAAFKVICKHYPTNFSKAP
jgi:hypothetical protein